MCIRDRRLTLSHETTEEEVDYMIGAVAEVVDYLRSISPVWRDLQSGKQNFVIQNKRGERIWHFTVRP